VPAILGRSVYSNHKRLVQVSGKALKMGTPDLQRAMAERPAFSALMLGYVDEVLFQTSQIGACNATHSLRHRLARWLCMACISEPDQELAVTHEAISRLLGVRRATVTECLNHLESEKVIETARGRIMIVDHEKLEHASCPCYQLMRSHRERFRAKYRDKFGG
jgi:CRP-like cAMP-binding protein